MWLCGMEILFYFQYRGDIDVQSRQVLEGMQT